MAQKKIEDRDPKRRQRVAKALAVLAPKVRKRRKDMRSGRNYSTKAMS